MAGGVSISEVTLSEICDLERAGLTHHAFSKHTKLHSTFTNSGMVYMQRWHIWPFYLVELPILGQSVCLLSVSLICHRTSLPDFPW